MKYTPEKLFQNADGTGPIFDEMWTGEWWWERQNTLPSGATIAPVILSSDKTQLSRFSGDKQAWPVYLSIGNIAKTIRRQPSKHATILIGYIPVTKLECFTRKTRSVEGYHVFHECMRSILEPLVAAGKSGIEMTCTDGGVRWVHPIVAAYVADHPEQCLVSGCQENFCPKCCAHSSELGDPVYSVMKDQTVIWDAIKEAADGVDTVELKSLGLRLIDPFWRELPHCDIFSCITLDLLHQLHKGIFKDHTVAWATACAEGGADEVDRRFKAMPSHPRTEHKHMEKVFLGILCGASDPAAVRAVRSVLNFIYYAHFHTHSDDSLACLEHAWAAFHANKDVFVRLGIRQHFNIPKLNSALHYLLSIRKLGTMDGYNTEHSEWLHIDFAKRGYSASNKREYIKQMMLWLSRQEAVHRFQTYLDWTEPTSDLPSPAGTQDASCDNPLDDEMDEGHQDGQQALLRALSIISESSLPSYILPKSPSLPGTTVGQLIRDFGCTDFIRALQDYLRKGSCSRTLPHAAQNLHPGSRFAAYKRMYLHLPPIQQLSHEVVKDVIRAIPMQPACRLVRASPAHFDTVLVRISGAEDSQSADSLDGK
ncbi:hypothetical protein BN946_scf184943.g3 [Trametes cinnabarina]|uniref:CxC2-like cysteine cluster KDZ transposase-associated domain-containing protein n=1 Tax=Pycnoporus cinnabarinus TaxID=5643 RepID=A0A060SIB9_PYCCI|nr:hypothetical protein BN946_scf184943.g3 [Trametes cinnabarina]